MDTDASGRQQPSMNFFWVQWDLKWICRGILGTTEKRSNWKTEHRVSNFKWLRSRLSSLELLASKAHVNSSPYVLFLQGFRHINLSLFRHISGTVRHYVLMVVFEFSCQNNGVSRRGWNGVKHQERPPGGLKSIKAYQNTDYKKKKHLSSPGCLTFTIQSCMLGNARKYQWSCQI